MCRHAAYLGGPVTLGSLLIDPPHSLYRQSWAPRRQEHGTVNADGFGIGWYAPEDPVPARYRRDGPIWADSSLPDIARVVRSGAVLAAVRDASPGTARGAEATAPFGAGPWLFSHNGTALGWREWAEPALALVRGPGGDGETSRPSLLSGLEAMTDSAVLWALLLDRLRAGVALDAALAAVIGAVTASGAVGRLNFLLTDGRTIAATARGDTLWYRRTGAGVTVASEPSDDKPGWTEVPGESLLTATRDAVTVRPLAPAGPPSADAPHRPAADRTAADTDTDTDTDRSTAHRTAGATPAGTTTGLSAAKES